MHRILTLAFCLLSLNLFAQKITYSPYQSYDIRSGDFSVVGEVGNKIYTYRSDADGAFLDAYNGDMQLDATVILDFLPKRVYNIQFFAKQSSIVVLYQAEKDGNVALYSALLNSDGMLQGRPNVLAVDQEGIFHVKRNLYEYAISTDGRKLVAYGIAEKGEDKVHCIWLNEDGTKSSRSIMRVKVDDNVAYGKGLVANDGRFFMPVYTAIGGRGYADRIWLMDIEENGTTHIGVEFPMGDKFASGTYMELDNNTDKISIGGFYSDKKNGNLLGVLYAHYNVADRTFSNVKNIPFTQSMANATGYRNKNKAFNDFRAMQLIMKNDGGFVLIAENFYITTRNGYNPGFGYYSWYYQSVSTSIREYHYEDILALSYDGNGNPEWHAFIRKNQYSQEDGGLFSSYALVNAGGALGFLYNDFNASRSRIQLSTIDGAGMVEHHSINTLGNRDPDWLPRSGMQIGANEMIVPCLRKQQICFAKIVF